MSIQAVQEEARSYYDSTMNYLRENKICLLACHTLLSMGGLVASLLAHTSPPIKIATSVISGANLLGDLVGMIYLSCTEPSVEIDEEEGVNYLSMAIVP